MGTKIRLFISVFLLLGGLTSCNIPTFEQDVKHNARKARDAVSDLTYKADRKLRETFDPETKDLIDRRAGLSREDYRSEFMDPTMPTIQDNPPDPVLPDVSSLLVEPRPPVIGQDKLVTIAVTEDIPLKEVLIELARRADVDIELDPGINGGIIFRAKDKPFSEIIERITELSGLRYSIKNGVLKVERDVPYIVNYKVDILNLVRATSGGVSISTSVLSGGGGGGEGGIDSGSTSDLSTESEADVWKEIETTLTNILNRYSGNVATLSTGGSPAAVDPATQDIFGAGAVTPTQASATSNSGDISSVISINKQTGIVTVLASSKQHKEIKTYLDDVQESQAAQVLIEAKILEVDLDDKYNSGIDWNLISSDTLNFSARGNFPVATSSSGSDLLTITALPQELFGDSDISLETAINFVEEFGVTRTLSSPRIHATHNQQAVLTFAENFVYFEVGVEQEEEGSGSTAVSSVTIESDLRTVPIGVILALQPSIDLDAGEITMNIRPTLSRIKSFVEDPGVSLTASFLNLSSSVKNEVPVVEVKEIDSILKVKSGQVMVIGGLMEERTQNTDKGVPYISSIPYVGNAFKSVKKETDIVETVIFIKATIVPTYGVGREDKEFYRKFSTDRRPLNF